MSTRLRLENVSRILEALWHRPEKSRADLARELRLDRSTIGIIADRLLDTGLIREEQFNRSGPKGGRPPLHLTIAPGTAYTIGVELTVPHIRLVALDLAGDRLEEIDLPILPINSCNSCDPDAVHGLLAAEIANLRRRIEHRHSFRVGLAAAGIGVSGVVNQAAMSIELSYALHIYAPLSLKAALEAVLEAPTLLLNDAQATALGEAERTDGDLLLAIVRDSVDDIGVGVGLVIDGKLVQGHSISHLLRPGQQEEGEDNHHFMDNLGRSLALLANTMGIDNVILGGAAADAAIYDNLKTSVTHYCSCGNPARNINVRPVSGGRSAVASGAASAAFRHVFLTRNFPKISEGIDF